jgi:hypothetical protein
LPGISFAEFRVRKHSWRASDEIRQESGKQAKKPDERGVPCAGFQLFQNMPGVDTRGDELRTLP